MFLFYYHNFIYKLRVVKGFHTETILKLLYTTSA